MTYDYGKRRPMLSVRSIPCSHRFPIDEVGSTGCQKKGAIEIEVNLNRASIIT